MIELINVNKKFGDKTILDNFNLLVNTGEMIAITGKSGSGKSTLLNILGLIEGYDSGTYKIFNEKNINPNSRKAQQLIKSKIGYLFQNYALIENESVESNLSIACNEKKNKKQVISDALEKVGLGEYEKKKVFELSGGEQQRVALARILIKPSQLILADEPTGSLDIENRDMVLRILKEINGLGKTVIIVTHDKFVSAECTRIIEL